MIRDSRDPDGPVLGYSRTAWHSFLGGVRDGAFDDETVLREVSH